MNYFAHALPHLDRPYFVAGVALPDWMNVVDRKLRIRSHHAEPFVSDRDPELADFAAGIMRHHADDAWFHRQLEFIETSVQLAVDLRSRLADEGGIRTGFLGHILVELLLDSELSQRFPERLDAYYDALRACEPLRIEQFVAQLAPRPAHHLQIFIPRFIEERFLYDYADDAKLWGRLNQVMRRVGLPTLPPSLMDWFPQARDRVRMVVDRLYPPPLS